VIRLVERIGSRERGQPKGNQDAGVSVVKVGSRRSFSSRVTCEPAHTRSPGIGGPALAFAASWRRAGILATVSLSRLKELIFEVTAKGVAGDRSLPARGLRRGFVRGELR